MYRLRQFAKLAPLTLVPFLVTTVNADVPPAPLAPAKGVFLWGDNSNRLISNAPDAPNAVRQPTKVDFLGDQTIKDLSVSPKFALAVLKNGNVVQWSSPADHQKLGKLPSIAKVLISQKSNHAIALGSNGKIYSWEPETPQQVKEVELVDSKLGWFEKIVDVQCGIDHLVALTNQGKVFSGFLSNNDSAQHHGQLGIAALPHFEPIPEPLKLHQIKLLEGEIKQIACGNYHTLFLNNNQELYGCGSNQFGQLMLPFTWKNTKVSVPTKLQSQCTSVAAGSSISLFNQQGSWMASGNGEFGQFGTGAFSQCQVSPIRISALENMREFDEASNSVKEIAVDQFSIGSTHMFATLNNAARDHLLWGSNEKGQLGNNKLSKVVKPIPATSASPIYQAMGKVKLVTGDKISGSFTL